MAITRQTREMSLMALDSESGRTPLLLIATRQTKASRNPGTSGIRRPVPVCWPCCRRKHQAITTTAGTSSATRSSFTTVAMSPVAGEIM
ncbi:hypothetical protein D3C87_1712270 [compost metagenome]